MILMTALILLTQTRHASRATECSAHLSQLTLPFVEIIHTELSLGERIDSSLTSIFPDFKSPDNLKIDVTIRGMILEDLARLSGSQRQIYLKALGVVNISSRAKTIGNPASFDLRSMVIRISKIEIEGLAGRIHLIHELRHLFDAIRRSNAFAITALNPSPTFKLEMAAQLNELSLLTRAYRKSERRTVLEAILSKNGKIASELLSIHDLIPTTLDNPRPHLHGTEVDDRVAVIHRDLTFEFTQKLVSARDIHRLLAAPSLLHSFALARFVYVVYRETIREELRIYLSTLVKDVSFGRSADLRNSQKAWDF